MAFSISHRNSKHCNFRQFFNLAGHILLKFIFKFSNDTICLSCGKNRSIGSLLLWFLSYFLQDYLTEIVVQYANYISKISLRSSVCSSDTTFGKNRKFSLDIFKLLYKYFRRVSVHLTHIKWFRLDRFLWNFIFQLLMTLQQLVHFLIRIDQLKVEVYSCCI